MTSQVSVLVLWQQKERGEEREGPTPLTSSHRTTLLGFCDDIVVGSLCLVDSEVQQPQGADQDESKAESVGPLDGRLSVGRVATTVEDEQQDDQQALISQLTPTLHEEAEV